MTAQHVIFQLAALALFWASFCRLSFTNKENTQRAVRWVFTAVSVTAAVAALAPWLADYEPDAMATSLMVVLAYTQIVTSFHWRHGVPHQFRKWKP